MYIKHSILLVLFATLLFSCKKEESWESVGNNNNNNNNNGNNNNGNNNSSDITGTWTFVNMTAHTNNTQTRVENGATVKYVSISDYTSIKNAGEMIIDAGIMVTKDFTFTADTQVYGTSYINGVSQGTLAAPYTFTSPVTNSSIPYKLIGKDSIYLSVGTVINGGTMVPSTPGGLKYKWSGDTLLFMSTAVLSPTPGYISYSTQTMRYIKK